MATQPRLAKLLQLHGYSACREALVLLNDHFNSSAHYESIEDFISNLNKIITFETDAHSSVISPDLAYLAIQKLNKAYKRSKLGDIDEDSTDDVQAEPQIPTELSVRLKNVFSDQPAEGKMIQSSVIPRKQANEFNIHYNFLHKRLISLPVFQGDFKLMDLSTLTASNQPSIRCICFGLLIKDIYKIDGYLLIDSTGRVPVRITPDTSFRNKLAYTNCIVLIEGVYANPDDILFAANIGLPPILLDPLTPKSSACTDDKSIVIIKELYLDDDDVCKSLERLFDKYNYSDNPPFMFILIGDFTRNPCPPEEFHTHSKKLLRIIRTCDNLKTSHFVFVPGQRDTSQLEQQQQTHTLSNNPKPPGMPKTPLTQEQMPINHLKLSNFSNIHLATNPTHIYLGDRQISVFAQSYMKELKKNLLHDISDKREDFFDTVRQIILSNAHMSAGISKTVHSSMNLWHRPDLLILADTEVSGSRHDYSFSSDTDTSFAAVPSFSRQFSKFRLYSLKTGLLEDSQVTSQSFPAPRERALDLEVIESEEDQI